MRVKKLRVYDQDPVRGVSNRYPTSKDALPQPCLHFISGQRNSGKSYLASKMLNQFKKDNTFDKIYLVSPSFASNRDYFGKHIREEDCFAPTKDAIEKIISLVEQDRDEFERFLSLRKTYDQFVKELKEKPTDDIDQALLMQAYDAGFMFSKPKWKYASKGGKVQPPRSLMILDDVLGSAALLQSSGLTRIATLNRHIAPLKETHSDRSACGLATIILAQSYKMRDGVSRVLRENLSALTVFATRQEKQYKALEEEIADVVPDLSLFRTAYDYSTSEPHGNLTIDFQSACASKIFRKNMNQLLLFDEMPCRCKK